MFREFNVKFENVDMIGGADNLLENTKVTKVIVRGDNKMSSLDSAFKNCSELDTIDGELDLNNISDIDNLLDDTTLVKRINLKNVNNENISVNNSFPHIEEITIGGELYNKKAIQNVLASKEWTFDNINYVDAVGENVVEKVVNASNDNEIVIKDTLEQKAKGIEITGQIYDNLIEDSGEVVLLDELILENVDGNKEFTPHIKQEVCVEIIEGETLQDGDNIYSIGKLQEDGTYKVDVSTRNNFTPLFYGEKNYGMTISDGASITFGENIQVTSKAGNALYTPEITLKPGQYLKARIISANGAGNHTCGIRTPNGGYVPSELGNLTNAQAIADKVSANGYFDFGGTVSTETTGRFYFAFNFGTYTIESITVVGSKDFIASTSEQSILLPQPLNKVGDIKDKFYWDEDKGHYCIEQNVNSDLTILDSSNVIDLPHLNTKYSLDTYMPTTYLQCVDTTIQPSRLLLKSDMVKFKPIFLNKNKEYQVKFNCIEKGNDIKVKLGDSEKTITPIVGENAINITTPQEITDSRLYLIGVNNKLSNVYVIADNMSTGELQEDGTYKIDLNTNNQTDSCDISIIANNPLGTDDKLYWSLINKRYEIDRNGEIEIPTVVGDVIDLPRLYQGNDTFLNVNTGNINPSKIEVRYLDIN